MGREVQYTGVGIILNWRERYTILRREVHSTRKEVIIHRGRRLTTSREVHYTGERVTPYWGGRYTTQGRVTP